MSDADQVKILMILIGVLWALVMRMVWRGYDNLSKRVDTLITQHVIVEKDMVGVKAEVAALREWRHAMANDEHMAVLRELQRRRNGNGHKDEPE